ncbi:hypothetical protein GCM10027169_14460 [Gordonia jinhuaensis]|uniref:Uncharacterized protein n=1 Tax=Gordonia jinhuaensis TaxID=1517702 RepID=A0A916SYJ2_9ACTN|nr:hypothetical protein [Gordonia jinhuaensis]GGB23566.1 hypothetical protein GCM10011489_09800 [Gordonia jinhuaensis]
MSAHRLTDTDLARTLYGATGVADAIIDAMESDPAGLKDASLAQTIADWRVPRVLSLPRRGVALVADAATAAVDLTGAPGTSRWQGWDRRRRVRWWNTRVGALTSILVAYPGVFGAAARRLPVADLAGFVNQLLLLTAALRVYSVTDRYEQTDRLAEVLCHRSVDSRRLLGPAEEGERSDEKVDAAEGSACRSRSPRALVGGLWSLKKTYDAIVDELAERPSPSLPWRWLGMVPFVGAPATYIGERRALRRADAELIERLESETPDS